MGSLVAFCGTMYQTRIILFFLIMGSFVHGEYLGVVYTIEREVFPMPYKNLRLVVELLPGPLQFTPTMEFGVLKRHVLRPTLSSGMVQHVL
jgi:hypothetical protein